MSFYKKNGKTRPISPSRSNRVYTKEEPDYSEEEADWMSRQDNEPDEEDAVMTDGRGQQTSLSFGGKYIGEFGSRDEAEAEIKRLGKQGKFYPSVWYVSDHGNAHPVTDFSYD